MPAEVETMFYTRVVPWHGKGVKVEEEPNSADALRLAGLDWEVKQEKIHVTSRNEKGHIRNVVVPDYKANVRSSDGSVLGIVGSKYRIVQNADAFAFTDELLGHGVRYDTAGSLYNGKKVWLLAKLTEDMKVLGDVVEPYLLFSNTHDGSGAVKVAMTPVRVVCANTLAIALEGAKRFWNTRHTGDITMKLAEAQRTLQFALVYMDQFQKTANELYKRKVNDVALARFLDALFPLPEVDEVAEARKRRESASEKLRERFAVAYGQDDLNNHRGTAWAVLNAVSDMATHAVPLRRTDAHEDSVMSDTLAGSYAMLDKAFDILSAEKVA